MGGECRRRLRLPLSSFSLSHVTAVSSMPRCCTSRRMCCQTPPPPVHLIDSAICTSPINPTDKSHGYTPRIHPTDTTTDKSREENIPIHLQARGGQHPNRIRRHGPVDKERHSSPHAC